MDKHLSKLAAAALVLACTFSSCSKDHDYLAEPDQPSPPQKVASQVYPLWSVSDPLIYGTITFQDFNNQTKVIIDLKHTKNGTTYPASINYFSVSAGGPVAITLNPVNGASGKSITNISATNEGTAVNYAGMIEFDGSCVITNSTSLVAIGEIGINY